MSARHRSGFALLEVMVALAIISFSCTVLISLSGTIAKTITKARLTVAQVQALSSVLVRAHQEGWYVQEKPQKQTVLDEVIEYSSKKIAEKSSLHAHKGLRREEVTTTSGFTKNLVAFIWNDAPEEKGS